MRQRSCGIVVGVQRTADRARRIDVALRRQSLVGRDDRCPGGRGACLVDVGDEHLRAVLRADSGRDRARRRRRPARGRGGPEVRRAETCSTLARMPCRTPRRGAAPAVAAAAGRAVHPRARSLTTSRSAARCSCRRRFDTCRRATRRAARSGAAGRGAPRRSAAPAPRARPCRRRARQFAHRHLHGHRLREPHRVGEPVGRRRS